MITTVNWCDILEDLYDSEINFSLTALWDSGITARIGLDGPSEEHRCVADAVEWLARRAVSLYPESKFARSHPHKFAE